jgi:hypothetical protein
LRSVKAVVGYDLAASDGKIGRCDDFLFDDRNWTVRYRVAKTAAWLPGRQVVISPGFLGEPDWAGGRLPVRLTRQQIEDAPPNASGTRPSSTPAKPIDRHYETAIHAYYGLPHDWTWPCSRAGSRFAGRRCSPAGGPCANPSLARPTPAPQGLSEVGPGIAYARCRRQFARAPSRSGSTSAKEPDPRCFGFRTRTSWSAGGRRVTAARSTGIRLTSAGCRS